MLPSHLVMQVVARVLAIVLACLTAGAIFVPIVSGTSKSEASIACGGQTNQIAAEFDMTHASDIWKVFPAMLRAPELEDDKSPAHVIVFGGEYQLAGMIAAAGEVPTVEDAVCVVQADGTVNLYDSVSKVGASLP